MTPELCRIMQNYKINIKLGIDVKLIILHIQALIIVIIHNGRLEENFEP